MKKTAIAVDALSLTFDPNLKPYDLITFFQEQRILVYSSKGEDGQSLEKPFILEIGDDIDDIKFIERSEAEAKGIIDKIKSQK